jgi:nicotinate-nucleotide pyrophosphorylase (carboxylating)
VKGIDRFVAEGLLRNYLMEDLGHGDITTCNLPNREKVFTATIRSKSKGTLAGIPMVSMLFSLLDARVKVEPLLEDGAPLEEGSGIATVTGPALALLRGERTALDILQRLSGIATLTGKMVKLISHTSARLVDTRKTTPGFRLFEKYAVTVGGAINHRMGLYDCAMIKDNHIKVAGTIKAAVKEVRKSIPFTSKIEVEVKSIAQLEEALDAGVEMVLLDNMDIPDLAEAVTLAKGKALTEASGGINENNVALVAQTGVDYISSGSLIHHASWLDMNMKID